MSEKASKINSMFEVMIEDTFDAAHQLVGYNGPCENMHGHGWKVQVHVKGTKLNELGMLVDFREVKTALKGLIDGLDHKNLNELGQFKKTNPTSENVAKYIYEGLLSSMKNGNKLDKVSVFESPTSRATFYGEGKSHLRILLHIIF